MLVHPATDVDRSRFLTLEELEAGMADVQVADTERSLLDAVVSRTELGHIALTDPVRLTAAGGVPGDGWTRKEGATVDTQITVMQTCVAELIANGQPLALFGDNLFVELDLSKENLPAGTRLAIGAAVLEVTSKWHKGCKKFAARFGVDALRFVATPVGRQKRYRGLYLKVLEEGDVAPGDSVEVVERAPAVEEAAV